MKKSIISFALALVLILSLLTACSPKIPLTQAAFSDLTGQAGYTAEAGCSRFDAWGVTSSVVAADLVRGIAIEFYIFPSPDNAKGAFQEKRSELKALGGTWYSLVEGNYANYNTYRGTHDGIYYALSCIDDTLIYVETEEANKAAVDDMLKTLGYR